MWYVWQSSLQELGNRKFVDEPRTHTHTHTYTHTLWWGSSSPQDPLVCDTQTVANEAQRKRTCTIRTKTSITLSSLNLIFKHSVSETTTMGGVLSYLSRLCNCTSPDDVTPHANTHGNVPPNAHATQHPHPSSPTQASSPQGGLFSFLSRVCNCTSPDDVTPDTHVSPSTHADSPHAQDTPEAHASPDANSGLIVWAHMIVTSAPPGSSSWPGELIRWKSDTVWTLPGGLDRFAFSWSDFSLCKTYEFFLADSNAH